jgi:hypothetical protein
MQLVVAFPGPLGPVTGDKQLEIGYQKGLLRVRTGRYQPGQSRCRRSASLRDMGSRMQGPFTSAKACPSHFIGIEKG